MDSAADKNAALGVLPVAALVRPCTSLSIYRLLVHDKLIQSLPEDQVSQQSMRHKLAIWYSKQLPKDDPPSGTF